VKKKFDLFKEEKENKGRYKMGDHVEVSLPYNETIVGTITDLDEGPVQVIRVRTDKGSGYYSVIVEKDSSNVRIV
jgi:hypothetical protein